MYRIDILNDHGETLTEEFEIEEIAQWEFDRLVDSGMKSTSISLYDCSPWEPNKLLARVDLD